MISVKLFESDKIPEEFMRLFKDCDSLIYHGIMEYVVGYFAKDVDVGKERWAKFDDWLKSQGAVDRENVFIHHGKFHLMADYLF